MVTKQNKKIDLVSRKISLPVHLKTTRGPRILDATRETAIGQPCSIKTHILKPVAGRTKSQRGQPYSKYRVLSKDAATRLRYGLSLDSYD